MLSIQQQSASSCASISAFVHGSVRSSYAEPSIESISATIANIELHKPWFPANPEMDCYGTVNSLPDDGYLVTVNTPACTRFLVYETNIHQLRKLGVADPYNSAAWGGLPVPAIVQQWETVVRLYVRLDHDFVFVAGSKTAAQTAFCDIQGKISLALDGARIVTFGKLPDPAYGTVVMDRGYDLRELGALVRHIKLKKVCRNPLLMVPFDQLPAWAHSLRKEKASRGPYTTEEQSRGGQTQYRQIEHENLMRIIAELRVRPFGSVQEISGYVGITPNVVRAHLNKSAFRKRLRNGTARTFEYSNDEKLESLLDNGLRLMQRDGNKGYVGKVSQDEQLPLSPLGDAYASPLPNQAFDLSYLSRRESAATVLQLQVERSADAAVQRVFPTNGEGTPASPAQKERSSWLSERVERAFGRPFTLSPLDQRESGLLLG